MFRSTHATGTDWRTSLGTILETLPKGEENLGFVYVTEPLAANLDDVLDGLRAHFGITDWVGSVGLGICALGAEYFDEPAMAVMLCDLPEGRFRLLDSGNKGGREPSDPEWALSLAPGPGAFGLPFIYCHADSANPRITGMVDGLAKVTEGYMVGGLTASTRRDHQVAGRTAGGGISGVMFEPDIGVVTSLSQGCRPIGTVHEIGECVDNILAELDGRRAFDVFLEDIGETMARDLNQVAGNIHVALPVAGSDTGDYVVRNLVGIDRDNGLIAIGAPANKGDKLMFVSRDDGAARDDLGHIVTRLKERAGGGIKGGLYMSCIARGPQMFGAQNAEMELVQAALGDIPLIGMYANGEISNNRLYSYTGVLTLFT